MNVEGNYRVEFEYGYEVDHHTELRIGSAEISLRDGIVEGRATDVSIEGVYELKRADFIHMDLIAKPASWNPVKKGEAMFFLRGQVAAESFVLMRPTGDDPRLFLRATCTRLSGGDPGTAEVSKPV